MSTPFFKKIQKKFSHILKSLKKSGFDGTKKFRNCITDTPNKTYKQTDKGQKEQGRQTKQDNKTTDRRDKKEKSKSYT